MSCERCVLVMSCSGATAALWGPLAASVSPSQAVLTGRGSCGYVWAPGRVLVAGCVAGCAGCPSGWAVLRTRIFH